MQSNLFMKSLTQIKIAFAVITFAIAFLFLFSYSTKRQIIEYKNNISDLETKINELEKIIVDNAYGDEILDGVNLLSGKVNEIEKRQNRDQLQNLSKTHAYLHVGQPDASFVDSGLGVLSFSLMNVSAYAAGSKITLRVGNPLAVDVNQIAMTLTYAEISPDSNDYSNKKVKKVVLNNNFKSGKFTTCEIVLEDILPSRLQMIMLHEVNTLEYTMLSESVIK